jgi:hypothetical protein
MSYTHKNTYSEELIPSSSNAKWLQRTFALVPCFMINEHVRISIPLGSPDDYTLLYSSVLNYAKVQKSIAMKEFLIRGLWFFIGLCVGVVWILADILTKNPVNKLNPFNDAILIALLALIMALAKWRTRKRNRIDK